MDTVSTQFYEERHILNTTFTAIGMTLTPSIGDYANKKLAEAFKKHLRDFAQSAILRFTFCAERVRDKEQRHIASVSVNVGGSHVNLSSKHSNLYAAIDELQRKLCTALTRLWNRKYARRGQGRHEARVKFALA